MKPAAGPIAYALATALATGSLPAGAAAADRATGDWGGVRARLSEAGVEIEVDYTAESFMRDDAENGSYLGNIDAFVVLDTEALGWWEGGQFVFYGQSNHSSGISRSLNLFMPVSNLDAEPFTQLSEFWLEQQVGERVTLRLGKQDANGDFAGPRFSGNFVNSSFGVLPGSPIPSFPAPALGAAVLTQPTSWLGIDVGVYEGNPEVESFGESAFEDDSGVFAISALSLTHEAGRPEAGIASIGGWVHTEPDRSGLYGIYDLLIHVNPADADDPRSFQMFLRGAWTNDEVEDEIGFYTGGGVTAHGFLGRNNTIGLGFGYVETDTEHEAFVELFFKWRPVPWLTIEPDVQLYETAHGNPLFAGLRLKLKL